MFFYFILFYLFDYYRIRGDRPIFPIGSIQIAQARVHPEQVGAVTFLFPLDIHHERGQLVVEVGIYPTTLAFSSCSSLYSATVLDERYSLHEFLVSVT